MADNNKSLMDKWDQWKDKYVKDLGTVKDIFQERVEWLGKYNEKARAALLAGAGIGDPSAMGAGAASLTPGNTNAEKAWNFFAGKGCTAAAAAGILGNLRQESGIDPAKKQYGGGPGRGIAQWEEGGRWNSLLKWAQVNGRDEWSIDTQLEYLWIDLGLSTTKFILDRDYGGLEGLRQATDYKWAVDAFEKSFERAGKPNLENRYKYAKEYLDQFGGGNGSSAAQTVSISDSSPLVVVQGGKVTNATGNRREYNKARATKAHEKGANALLKLPSDKFASNLDGCTMRVDKDFYPAINLVYESMKANGLLVGNKMLINSAYRYKDPDQPGLDYGAHGWGGAIDIGAKGLKNALQIADICWALGFRAVAVGGSLNAGRGFVHVDIGPPASWGYGYGTYKGPGTIG